MTKKMLDATVAYSLFSQTTPLIFSFSPMLNTPIDKLDQPILKKELFIVEGKSAASTIRQAMHKPTQSVYAIQGKFINVDKASRTKVLANQEVQKLLQHLSCGIGDNCMLENLTFSRILILADPDADGIHVQILLLNFFANYVQPLIASGNVYAIRAPLFRLATAEKEQLQYAWNQDEADKILQNHSAKNQSTKNKLNMTRFKGIAQFSSAECASLLLQPNTRKSSRITNEKKKD
jgi:topoisomerase-4 subunit B